MGTLRLAWVLMCMGYTVYNIPANASHMYPLLILVRQTYLVALSCVEAQCVTNLGVKLRWESVYHISGHQLISSGWNRCTPTFVQILFIYMLMFINGFSINESCLTRICIGKHYWYSGNWTWPKKQRIILLPFWPEKEYENESKWKKRRRRPQRWEKKKEQMDLMHSFNTARWLLLMTLWKLSSHPQIHWHSTWNTEYKWQSPYLPQI